VCFPTSQPDRVCPFHISKKASNNAPALSHRATSLNCLRVYKRNGGLNVLRTADWKPPKELLYLRFWLRSWKPMFRQSSINFQYLTLHALCCKPL
jgi:hypothetical protein